MAAAAPSDIDIKRFDPTTMKPNRISVCVGKRGTGKSVLMRDLLWHSKDSLHSSKASVHRLQVFRYFYNYFII